LYKNVVTVLLLYYYIDFYLFLAPFTIRSLISLLDYFLRLELPEFIFNY